MQRVDSLEKTLMLGGIRGRRRRDDRGWDGWMASLTRWTWVWVNSGSWWWTGRPGVLQFMGSQRVRHDCSTELNWTELNVTFNFKNQTKRKPYICSSCGGEQGYFFTYMTWTCFSPEGQWSEEKVSTPLIYVASTGQWQAGVQENCCESSFIIKLLLSTFFLSNGRKCPCDCSAAPAMEFGPCFSGGEIWALLTSNI